MINNTSKRLHASFWKYEGNSHGQDCPRKDPHCFGIGLISFLAYYYDIGDAPEPLLNSHLEDVSVNHRKGDDFGHEIMVAAPKEIWDLAKASWKNYLLSEGWDDENAERLVNNL